jgi:HK97 family phage prohead protease
MTTTEKALREQLKGTAERWMPASRSPIEMRSVDNGTGGTSLVFTGYACVVESGYEMQDAFGSYTETVSRGAFNRTLANGADCVFVPNHGAGGALAMARTKSGTLRLSADMTGLYTEARLDPTRSDVQILRSAVEAGDLDEMSFCFRVVDQEWDVDFENRRILEVNLSQGDVSPVTYGANPATAGTVGVSMRRKGDPVATDRPHGSRLLAVPDHTPDARLRLEAMRQRGQLGALRAAGRPEAIPDHTASARERLQLLRLKGRRPS